MDNLIGMSFEIDGVAYIVIDARNIHGEMMVYAEPAREAKGPGRAAFRYADIESRVARSSETA